MLKEGAEAPDYDSESPDSVSSNSTLIHHLSRPFFNFLAHQNSFSYLREGIILSKQKRWYRKGREKRGQNGLFLWQRSYSFNFLRHIAVKIDILTHMYV